MMMFLAALPGLILVLWALKRLREGHPQVTTLPVRVEAVTLTPLAKRLRMASIAPGFIRGSRDGFPVTVNERRFQDASTYRVSVDVKNVVPPGFAFSREGAGTDNSTDLDTGDADFDRTVNWRADGTRSWAGFVDKHTRKAIVEFLKVSPDAALTNGCLTFSVSSAALSINTIAGGVASALAAAKALRRAHKMTGLALFNTVADESVTLVRERALRHLLTQFPGQRKHVIKALRRALGDDAATLRWGAAVAALGSVQPDLRQKGASTLREVSEASTLEALNKLLSTSSSLLVLEQVCLALERMGDRTSVLPLREFAKSMEDRGLRDLARHALSAIQGRLGAGNAGGIALVENAHHEGAVSVGDFGAVSEAPDGLETENDKATRTREKSTGSL